MQNVQKFAHVTTETCSSTVCNIWDVCRRPHILALIANFSSIISLAFVFCHRLFSHSIHFFRFKLHVLITKIKKKMIPEGCVNFFMLLLLRCPFGWEWRMDHPSWAWILAIAFKRLLFTEFSVANSQCTQCEWSFTVVPFFHSLFFFRFSFKRSSLVL